MKDRSAPAPRRTLARRVAILALGLALLCAGLWLGRRPLVAGLAGAVLARAGFPDVALTVVEVGLDGIELRDVRARDSALEIASLEARWSPAQRRIDALHARGIRLRADLRGAGGAPSEPGRLAALALALPRNVRIEDAQLALDSDFGPFALALQADVRESEGALRGTAEVSLTREASRARLTLALQGTHESFEGSLALDGESAGFPELPLALALSGKAQLRWRERVLELYTPECVELRVARGAAGSVRVAAPFVACAGAIQTPAVRVELADAERVRWRAELPLRAPRLELAFGAGDAPVAVSLREPQLDLKLETPAEGGAPGLTLEAAGARAESAALALRADVWKVSARLSADGALESTLDARVLRDLRTPANLTPLALRGTLARTQAGAALALRFELASAGRRIRIDGEGALDPEMGRARAQLTLQPLKIGPGAAPLRDLSPALGRLLGGATGRVEAKADVSIDAQGPRVEVDLALRDASFETRAARFSGVNGRILLQGPSPWSTPPDQLVSAALTDIGLPLTDGLLRFQLRPGAALNVASATWRMFGGELRIQGPFDFGAERRTLVLEVRGLDLAEIARAAELKGLSGTGTLDGKIPIRFADESVFFEAADLHSTGEGGTIQYRPEQGAHSLGSRPGIVLALRALEDFRYQELRITLDGDASAPVNTGLYIRGSNPQLERGRPVEFNVNVNAPISALLRSSLAGYRLPEAIDRNLRDFPGAELP